MQELEKILEEIRKAFEENTEYIADEDGYHHFVIDSCTATYLVNQIIRKHMNDGWIPVEKRPPKTNGTYNVTRYIDGHFISDSAYFDGQNTWHSDNRVNHSRPYLTDVIAWRPLPEPYKPKQPETCKYTGGSCCWPVDQCSDCPNNPERSENDQ